MLETPEGLEFVMASDQPRHGVSNIPTTAVAGTSLEALQAHGSIRCMPPIVRLGGGDLTHHGPEFGPAWGALNSGHCIHSSPPIYSIPAFLSEKQCAALIRNALSGAGQKTASDMQTFGSSTKRTSTSWLMPPSTPCVGELIALAQTLTGCSSERFEVAQVIRYCEAQEYAWHLDTLPLSAQGHEGNRSTTLIVYLNTLSYLGGGHTCFRDLEGIDVAPVVGTALLFFPAFGSAERRGEPDFRTVHCSLPAAGNETKWIAQIFVRERGFAGGQACIPGY